MTCLLRLPTRESRPGRAWRSGSDTHVRRAPRRDQRAKRCTGCDPSFAVECSRCDTWTAAIESRPHFPHWLTRDAMAQEPARPSPRRPDETTSDRLDSWKDVAAYLQRDVSTVQRWEKREAMPVHRHVHEKQGTVYAFRLELDAWWRGRGGRAVSAGRRRIRPSTGGASVPRTGEPAARRSGARRHLPTTVVGTLARHSHWHGCPRNGPDDRVRTVPLTGHRTNRASTAPGSAIRFAPPLESPTIDGRQHRESTRRHTTCC